MWRVGGRLANRLPGFRECAQGARVRLHEISRFPREFDEGGRLKNRQGPKETVVQQKITVRLRLLRHLFGNAPRSSLAVAGSCPWKRSYEP